MKKTINVLLIISLFFPLLSIALLPKPAEAANVNDLSTPSSDRVDYQITVDGQKAEVWSVGERKHIPIETFQQNVKEKIERTKIPGSTGKVDIGIQFEAKNVEAKNKSSRLGSLLNFLGLVNIAHAFEWKGNFSAFFVYIQGPGYHPLGNCVQSNVTHYKVVIKRYSWTPDTQAWVILHIGTYYSNGKKCFVFWDSQHSWICLRLCSPTWSFLRDNLYYAMIGGGVTVSATLLYYAAGTIATILWPVLIVL